MRLLLLPAILFALAPACRAAAPADPKYAAVVTALEALARREVTEKKLPALSIALVDDQTIVWSAGFGFADAAKTRAATGDTIYRIGSVSKLFTDLAVMRLVEQRRLDLDLPVATYLPEFHPDDPLSGPPITLRHLMTHRSGLVREPPAGNYFDPAGATLAATVASLNRTKLVHKPGEVTKYSNAAIATVGLVLERRAGKPFATVLRDELIKPLGLEHSDFEPTAAVKKDLAQGLMWTLHDREFPAPTFQLGMAPAGSMYSSAHELGRFLSVLFAGGKSSVGRVVKPETLQTMWTPQYAAPGAKTGFGVGFHIGQLEGRRTIGHSGAIYGFATELTALPDDKLGVVVIASRDCSNAVTTRIGNDALRQMLAAKQDRELPKISNWEPVAPEVASKWEGIYAPADQLPALELSNRNGNLRMWPLLGGAPVELRQHADGFITDGCLEYGMKLAIRGADALQNGPRTYRRQPVASLPKGPPQRWHGLIGEYGWDHNTLYILEREGRLYALIEWFYLYPLVEEAENVFRFPSTGLYSDEKLIFTRDKNGRAEKVEAASVVFARRPLPGDGAPPFRVKSSRPVAELIAEARSATPPEAKGEFAKPDLVDLATLDPTIKFDIRYATADNFLGAPVYPVAKAFLQRPAAEAMARAHKALAADGYGLLIHDAYRPWRITKAFWEATPQHQRQFVADPSVGSRHNRGCAVDLSLYDLSSGRPIVMPSDYDEFSDRAYPDYPGGAARPRWYRDRLRRAMEAEGFAVYEAEWWHFDYRDWKKYPVQNAPLEQLGR